jgi:hypothetical protein
MGEIPTPVMILCTVLDLDPCNKRRSSESPHRQLEQQAWAAGSSCWGQGKWVAVAWQRRQIACRGCRGACEEQQQGKGGGGGPVSDAPNRRGQPQPQPASQGGAHLLPPQLCLPRSAQLPAGRRPTVTAGQRPHRRRRYQQTGSLRACERVELHVMMAEQRPS